MTGQLPDFFELDAITYSLAGVNGGPLFDPTDYSIKPATINTACWRGYVSVGTGSTVVRCV